MGKAEQDSVTETMLSPRLTKIASLEKLGRGHIGRQIDFSDVLIEYIKQGETPPARLDVMISLADIYPNLGEKDIHHTTSLYSEILHFARTNTPADFDFESIIMLDTLFDLDSNTTNVVEGIHASVLMVSALLETDLATRISNSQIKNDCWVDTSKNIKKVNLDDLEVKVINKMCISYVNTLPELAKKYSLKHKSNSWRYFIFLNQIQKADQAAQAGKEFDFDQFARDLDYVYSQENQIFNKLFLESILEWEHDSIPQKKVNSNQYFHALQQAENQKRIEEKLGQLKDKYIRERLKRGFDLEPVRGFN